MDQVCNYLVTGLSAQKLSPTPLYTPAVASVCGGMPQILAGAETWSPASLRWFTRPRGSEEQRPGHGPGRGHHSRNVTHF